MKPPILVVSREESGIVAVIRNDDSFDVVNNEVNARYKRKGEKASRRQQQGVSKN